MPSIATSPKTLVLFAPATISADTNGSDIVIPPGYSGMKVRIKTGTATGTSPTLNVYVQEPITDIASSDTAPNPTSGTVVYDDFISFTQITASTQTREARVQAGSNVEAAVTSGSLTAGTVKNGPLPDKLRIRWDVGGTSPNFGTCSAIVKLYP